MNFTNLLLAYIGGVLTIIALLLWFLCALIREARLFDRDSEKRGKES